MGKGYGALYWKEMRQQMRQRLITTRAGALGRHFKQLAEEFQPKHTLVMPVGLFLVVDKENGGDGTAEQVIRRFGLLERESADAIDFYFLGWEAGPDNKPCFRLSRFQAFRDELKRHGIGKWGGNADLILVDAHYTPSGKILLNFEEAIQVDLAAGTNEKDFPTVGAFLQSIIEVAEDVKRGPPTHGKRGVTYVISDRLGLAIAKKSILAYIFEKWGKLIGAKKLSKIATRKLGPKLGFTSLEVTLR